MKKYWMYMKWFLAALVLVFMIIDGRGDSVSDAEIETVAENVMKAAGVDASQIAKNRMFKRFYGLNVKDYEGAVLCAPEDNMDARELLIVKLKSTDQQEEVRSAIEERLDTQTKSFEGYDAEQAALLKKHVLVVKGNYIFYMVGEETQNAQKAFLNSL